MNTMLVLALFGCPEEGKDDSGVTDTTTTTTTTTTTPDPIAVSELNIVCAKDESSVTFTATTTGMYDEAILNFSDFANSPPGAEEHLFTFDGTTGDIEALELATPGDTIFNCTDHFAEASAVMSYTVRLYDQGTLADCGAGSESGDAQAFIDDVVKNMTTGFTDTDDFASCSTDLTLSY